MRDKVREVRSEGSHLLENGIPVFLVFLGGDWAVGQAGKSQHPFSQPWRAVVLTPHLRHASTSKGAYASATAHSPSRFANSPS